MDRSCFFFLLERVMKPTTRAKSQCPWLWGLRSSRSRDVSVRSTAQYGTAERTSFRQLLRATFDFWTRRTKVIVRRTERLARAILRRSLTALGDSTQWGSWVGRFWSSYFLSVHLHLRKDLRVSAWQNRSLKTVLGTILVDNAQTWWFCVHPALPAQRLPCARRFGRLRSFSSPKVCFTRLASLPRSILVADCTGPAWKGRRGNCGATRHENIGHAATGAGIGDKIVSFS